MIQITALVAAVAAEVDADLTGEMVKAETPVISGSGFSVWIIPCP